MSEWISSIKTVQFVLNMLMDVDGFILKPILFYLLIILFDGSGDINFSLFCFYFCFPLIFSTVPVPYSIWEGS